MADKPMIKGPDIYIGGKPKPKSRPKMTDELRKRGRQYEQDRRLSYRRISSKA
jgi:hypothetical protein